MRFPQNTGFSRLIYVQVKWECPSISPGRGKFYVVFCNRLWLCCNPWIVLSPLVEGLRNESRGHFGLLRWVMTPSPVMIPSKTCQLSPVGMLCVNVTFPGCLWVLQLSQLFVRKYIWHLKYHHSISTVSAYSLQGWVFIPSVLHRPQNSPSPFQLWGSVCENLCKWVCGLWSLLPELIFYTAAVFGFSCGYILLPQGVISPYVQNNWTTVPPLSHLKFSLGFTQLNFLKPRRHFGGCGLQWWRWAFVSLHILLQCAHEGDQTSVLVGQSCCWISIPGDSKNHLYMDLDNQVSFTTLGQVDWTRWLRWIPSNLNNPVILPSVLRWKGWLRDSQHNVNRSQGWPCALPPWSNDFFKHSLTWRAATDKTIFWNPAKFSKLWFQLR